MKIMFWRNRKPYVPADDGPPWWFESHSWDGNYACVYCNIYWDSRYPESHYGRCPGYDPDED